MKTSIHIILCIGALALLAACQPDDRGPCPACPSITSISPDHGRGGDEITINGTNFQNFIIGEDKVTINGEEAQLTDAPTATTLRVLVPSQAGSGPVLINIGPLSSAEVGTPQNFTYDLVEVDSINPVLAKKDEIITIHGALFHPDPEGNLVIFSGDKEAEVVEVSESILKVKVPIGASAGPVQITVDNFTTEGPEFTYIPTATVSTFAGPVDLSFPKGIAIDNDDNLFVIDEEGIKTITQDGTITKPKVSGQEEPFNYSGIAFSNAGIYLSSGLTKSEILLLIATGGGGLQLSRPQISLPVKFPQKLLTDSQGNLFISDKGNHRILKVKPSGESMVYAGIGEEGTENGTTASARLSCPYDMVIDAQGNLLVTESGQSKGVRKITPDGVVSTLSGSTNFGFFDGPQEEAVYKTPHAIGADSKGNLFIADSFNQCIRMISTTGIVVTLAGSPLRSGLTNGDGGVAAFSLPEDLAVASDGSIYIADQNNDVIRKIILE